MNRMLVCAALLAFATTSTVAVAGGCGDVDCTVGALGQGGVSSGGTALGSHEAGIEFGSPFKNSGTALSGHLDATVGTLSGHYNENTNAATGHVTGIFGDWSGVCDFDNPDPC